MIILFVLYIVVARSLWSSNSFAQKLRISPTVKRSPSGLLQFIGALIGRSSWTCTAEYKKIPTYMTTFCDWPSETIMISVYDSFFRNEFFIVLLSWSTIHRRGSYRYVVTLNIDWYVYNSTAYSVSKSVSPRWRKSLNFLLRNYLLYKVRGQAL